ncbi:MAG TPA: hypothetical protein DCE41_20370 [Cytophagales bacterium]|nr:hypothetical protein [Cytophagales bacterium]HAA23336.1 hypothetical protein [Cytophagales bacterium]HAP65007.1 hypothetical protein [Cytophagales bacterium]
MTTTLRISLLALSSLFCVHLHAQSSCQVNLEELDGSYEGDCRAGLAHGQGKSAGSESYQGEWRKGFPDGFGTYTYACGDVYEGYFERGRREGQGTLTYVDGEIKEGIWQNDKFAGYYSEAYEFIEKPLTGSYSIQRMGSEENRVEIILTNKGTAFNPYDLDYVCSTGVAVRYPNRFGWEAVEYPCTINVSYSVQVGVYLSPVKFEIEIKEPGDWKMVMRH